MKWVCPQCSLVVRLDANDKKIRCSCGHIEELGSRAIARKKSPGIFRRASNYLTAMKAWEAAGKPTRSQREITEILDNHCRLCRWYNAEKKICSHHNCGCAVNEKSKGWVNKIAAATESCPIGKWFGQVDFLIVVEGDRHDEEDQAIIPAEILRNAGITAHPVRLNRTNQLAPLLRDRACRVADLSHTVVHDAQIAPLMRLFPGRLIIPPGASRLPEAVRNVQETTFNRSIQGRASFCGGAHPPDVIEACRKCGLYMSFRGGDYRNHQHMAHMAQIRQVDSAKMPKSWHDRMMWIWEKIDIGLFCDYKLTIEHLQCGRPVIGDWDFLPEEWRPPKGWTDEWLARKINHVLANYSDSQRQAALLGGEMRDYVRKNVVEAARLLLLEQERIAKVV